MTLHLTTAEPWHAELLVPLLGPENRVFFTAIGGGDPVAMLKAGIAESTSTWTGWDGDTPLGIGGVTPLSLLSSEGVIWQVTQPGLRPHKKWFLRQTREQIAILRTRYSRLINYMLCDPKSERWLEWLGFKLGDVTELNGVPVRLAELRA